MYGYTHCTACTCFCYVCVWRGCERGERWRVRIVCMYVCIVLCVCTYLAPAPSTARYITWTMDMTMDQMHHSCTFCTSCNSTSHLGPVYALFGPELHSISCTVISRPVPPKPAKACMLTLGAQLNFFTYTYTYYGTRVIGHISLYGAYVQQVDAYTYMLLYLDSLDSLDLFLDT